MKKEDAWRRADALRAGNDPFHGVKTENYAQKAAELLEEVEVLVSNALLKHDAANVKLQQLGAFSSPPRKPT